MSGKTHIRRQRPVLGGRRALPALVIKEIERHVTKIAERHGVSKSFVIAVALADHFGITSQERYRGS